MTPIGDDGPHSLDLPRQGREVAERLIDARAAAELLGVPRGWVLAKARAGELPHVRLGRYVRFEEPELRRWWASRRHGPGTKPWSG